MHAAVITLMLMAQDNILLGCAVAVQSVKAFVYTSSATVVEGVAQHMASEDTRVKTEKSKCDDYAKSKALAETMVLQTNGTANMLTVCLRLPSTYGERDEQNIGEGIKAMRRNEHKLQVGDNTNLCEWLSAENAAQAHLLAVEALLAEHQQPKEIAERVAGEAFFVTDGEALPFWDHFRLIWRAAGDRTAESEVTKIPPLAIMSLAAIVETIYWIFTFGRTKPKAMRRDLLAFTFLERTFSIDKARKRLGYILKANRNAQVQAGVRWYLDQHFLGRDKGD
ncbi:NAD(P)-binding protein [Viridothelium virens]|uniref:NAD(P)-binding protein n=1 Tax=Viridothelium virens TaxID=1048519 RepID=A0A6A6HJ50_VIRVR|nr:NAD(P)-binding protein [Viridothelium virens]